MKLHLPQLTYRLANKMTNDSSDWEMKIASILANTCTDKNSSLLGLAEGIQCGKPKLCDVVEYLHGQLTNPDKEERLKSLALIVDVIKKIHINFLNSQEASLLCDFFCDRLKDHYTLLYHTLQGLIYIGKLSQLDGVKVVGMLHALFNNVHNQSQRQEDRHLFYTCVYNCVTLRTNDLKVMDNELVCGFIKAMEGEKDPRNLLIIFKIIPLITRYYTISPLEEELFEVIGCYFPIEFKPINKNGQTVTEEDLVLGLRRCLSSTGDFADFCLPMLVEKLTSSLQSAKLESLLTLEACAPVYPTKAIDEFFLDIWSCIKEEVFNSVHEATASAAISTLVAIIKSDVASIQSNARNTATAHLEMILKDCVPHLNEPNNKLMLPSAKILCAVAKSSRTACIAITHAILPMLLHNANRDDQKRVPTMQTLIEFLGETQHIVQNDEDSNPFYKYKSAFVALFQTCALSSNAELSFQGLRGLETIISAKDLLNEQELVPISELVLDIALNTSEEKLKNQALSTLSVFATKNKELASRCIIGNQINRIVQIPPTGCERLLQTLVAVSTKGSQAQVVLDGIFKFITGSLQVPGTGSVENITAALKSMSLICTRVNLQENQSQFFNENVIDPLLKLTEELSCVAKDVADLFRATVPYLDTRQSSQLVQVLATSFLGLTGESPAYVAQKVQIFEGVVSAMPNKTVMPQVQDVTTRIIKLSCQAQDHTSEICARCLCSLVNKIPDDQTLDQLLLHITTELEISTQHQPHLVATKIFPVWIWLTKGLLMRGYDQVDNFVYKVTDYLQQDFDTRCASRFRILTEDIPELTTNNVRMLYKQRLFLIAYPRLMRNVESSSKLSNVFALAALVDCLPMQAVRSELPNILIRLMEGLVLNCDVEMTEALMRTLGSVLESVPLLFVPHLGRFIDQCLRLSSEASSMKIRMSALRCLVQASTSLPVEDLMPHQDKVTLGLVPCLDDKKRLVRKYATQARTRWYLVGSPGGFNV